MARERLKPKPTKSHRVKAIVSFVLPSEQGMLTGKRHKQYEEYFNANGNRIEFIEYKAGQIVDWVQYAYDNNGVLLETTRYTGRGYDKSKFTPVTTKARQGEKMPEAEKAPIVNAISKERVHREFYKNGKIREETFYRSDGARLKQIQYKGEKITSLLLYNEWGKLYDHAYYDPSGEIYTHRKYEYDNLGKLIRETNVERGVVLRDIKYIYDDQSKLIVDHDIYKEEYRLWNTDLKWKDINTVGYNNKYFYNEKELLCRQEMYLGENLIMTYEFEFEYWSD